MVPPKLPNPASGLASRIGDQSSSPKVTEVNPATGKSSKQGGASPESAASAEQHTLAKPTPAAIFILSSGERLESNDYTLTHESVRLTLNGVQRTVPMSAVNVQATLAANKERGIDLKIPANKSQMVLAF